MRNTEIIEKRNKLPIFTPKEGLTEEVCIEQFNNALKAYLEHDCDGEDITYILIPISSAENLFNELFENGTFQDYLETYVDEPEDGCDITPMWALLCNLISEDVKFNTKSKQIYKMA